MFGIRRSESRGHVSHLNSRHYYSFSFGDYQDPIHNGFGPLKVINEDQLAPLKGFPEHPHSDIELLTFVSQGTLRYQDNLGTAILLEEGDFQLTSCGSGIEHSVYNHNDNEDLVVYQFWVTPNYRGLVPQVDHWELPDHARRGRWALVATPEGDPGSMMIHRDVSIWTARLDPGQELDYAFPDGRHGWLQVTQGSLELGKKKLYQGDGVAIMDEPGFVIKGRELSEVVFFDLLDE